jgi:hypothetical protein
MHYIIITSVPPGQAPLWVRQAWVGLSIPLIENPRQGVMQTGVGGGAPSNSDGYVVSASVAISRLHQIAPAAGRWWQKHLPFSSICEMVFATNVCRILAVPLAKKTRRRW